jgi:hypothetical protein
VFSQFIFSIPINGFIQLIPYSWNCLAKTTKIIITQRGSQKLTGRGQQQFGRVKEDWNEKENEMNRKECARGNDQQKEGNGTELLRMKIGDQLLGWVEGTLAK